jgi:hypothetical protein
MRKRDWMDPPAFQSRFCFRCSPEPPAPRPRVPPAVVVQVPDSPVAPDRQSPRPPFSPFPRDPRQPVYATSSPKACSSSRPKLRISSSRSRRSDRQMLDFTVPTLMPRMSAISGSVRPS